MLGLQNDRFWSSLEFDGFVFELFLEFLENLQKIPLEFLKIIVEFLRKNLGITAR
jgi:hypothetical protein